MTRPTLYNLQLQKSIDEVKKAVKDFGSVVDEFADNADDEDQSRHSLEAELEELRGIESHKNDFEDENKLLRAALEFYAEEKNYDDPSGMLGSKAELDRGRQARDAMRRRE